MYNYTNKFNNIAQKLFLVIFSLLFVASCASYRPVVDENSQYKKVGSARAEADIDDCLAKADKYLEVHKSDRMKRDMKVKAITGAVIGGVVGLASGKTLGTTVAGSAVGAGIGAADAYGTEKSKDLYTPDELKQNYVTNCLSRKKYQVIGWK